MTCRHRLLRPGLILFLVAGCLAAALDLPWGTAVQGQTIPLPTETPVPSATAVPRPTNTATPRPTWTVVSKPTATKAPSHPTDAPETAAPTATEVVPAATEAPAAYTATAEPPGLILEVTADPTIAGPGDMVRFTARLENVGRGAAVDVRLVASLPGILIAEAPGCDGCAVDPATGTVTFALAGLESGAQATVTLPARVSEDAWPGQVATAAWELTAANGPTEHAKASVTLPWAELPATGRLSDNADRP